MKYDSQNYGLGVKKGSVKEIVKLLLESKRHCLLTPDELNDWNNLFFDHFATTKYTLCPKGLAHKTKDDFVVIGKPIKHPKGMCRAILIPNKFAKGSLYEDPELPILEGVHLIEAFHQLGAYLIEEQQIPLGPARFIGFDTWSLTESLNKSEEYGSIEISSIEISKLPGGTILGKYFATIYKGNDVIGGGSLIFSVEEYSEKMVDVDIKSGLDYKVKRANEFTTRNTLNE